MSNQTTSTPKNLDKGGTRIAPNAYSIKYIILENHRGDSWDISNLVVSTKIQESLYSPTLLLELQIKDNVNFLESAELIGQEKLSINFSYIEHEQRTNREIVLEMFVTEYPSYGRTNNQRTHVYSLKAISEQSIVSTYTKVKQAYNPQLTTSIIKKIITTNLNLDEDKFKEGKTKAISKTRVIATEQSPLRFIELLRTKTYDANSMPFYMYQSLDGNYNLVSLSDILDEDLNPIYQTYKDAKLFTQDHHSFEDYIDKATRIISVTSNLKFNKFTQTREGAFASKNEVIDFGCKTFKTYNYKADEKSFKDGFSSLSSLFKIKDGKNGKLKKLDEFQNSCVKYQSINSNSFDSENDKDLVTSSINNVQRLEANVALMESTTHDIKLFGDFMLNPGRLIELKFPKAIEPEYQKEVIGESNNNVDDLLLSGKYFISSSIHTFENGDYYTNVRVKRKSFPIKIS